MVCWANHSRLPAESGPPQWEVTARVREGQRKRERVVPSSNWAWHFALRGVSFFLDLLVVFGGEERGIRRGGTW